MTAAEIFQSLIHVAGLALVFGAGIPLLFSLGMRCMTGDPIRDDNGVVVGDTPASTQMKVLGWTVYAAVSYTHLTLPTIYSV